MDNQNSYIKQNFQKTIDELEEIINVLKKILSIVSSKENIKSFKGSYCKDCNESCGSSNAEIYNCMKKKISWSKTDHDRIEQNEYSKEYLEKDLEKIIKNLKMQNSNFKKILISMKDDK